MAEYEPEKMYQVTLKRPIEIPKGSDNWANPSSVTYLRGKVLADYEGDILTAVPVDHL